jgi:hypothetical protein
MAGYRHGRSIVDRLYYNHVAHLLDDAVYPVKHLRLQPRAAS